MHISYIIYIILNSRCYTGVRAPKLSHRSSYIKEPFGKGLDGLPGGWTGASEGLEGGLRGLRPVQGGFKGAWEGLQGGFKGAWEGLEGGLLEGGFKGAWEGLQGGFKGASRGLEKGLKGASRWRGLQGGLKGAWEGLQGGFKGAWEGLQGGLRRASRGLQGGFKPFSPSCPPPPGKGPFQAPLEGYLRRWWLGSSPPSAQRQPLPLLNHHKHWTKKPETYLPRQFEIRLKMDPAHGGQQFEHISTCMPWSVNGPQLQKVYEAFKEHATRSKGTHENFKYRAQPQELSCPTATHVWAATLLVHLASPLGSG